MSSEDSPALDATDPHVGPSAPTTPFVKVGHAAGDKLGVYEIVRAVGSGGMGEVFEARDPRLERSVAIKVLRRSQPGAGRQHLVREALALAKLSHPNIVTVHEIDTHGDETFVVMEYLDGGTVRGWLKQRPHSVREILRVFLDAGRGLAAAHGAGLVHRDFKPDNMLLDRKGRVRVSDFGLVASIGDDRGDVAGTPIYMAPEQHAGLAVDARCDQFSFCVTLYEALYGAAPFRGPTVAELARAKRETHPEIPAKKGVTARLRAALERGLEPDPEKRHPSMEPLLAALAWDPASRRARVAMALGMAALAGTSAWGFLRPAATVDACAAGTSRLEAAWSPAIRDQGRAAFLATGRPYAADTWARVEAQLDRHAARYAELRRAACAPGRKQEAQVACLDWRLEEMAELARLFGRADATIVDQAARAAGGLDLGACSHPGSSLGLPALPDDPAARARVEEGLSRVEGIRALANLGRYKDGVAAGRALIADARPLENDTLLARALVVTARMASLAGDDQTADSMLREAMPIAARARDDDTAASAAILSIWSIGVEQDRYDEAATLVPVAEGAVARAGGARLRAELDHTLGVFTSKRGRHAEALELLRRALKLREDNPEIPDSDKAQTLVAIARALQMQGKFDEAEPHLRQALAIAERELGPMHINVAGTLSNLGNLERKRGHLDAAALLYERARAIYAAVLGSESSSVAGALGSLAYVEIQRGHTEQAIVLLNHAIPIDEKALGPDHPDVAGLLMRLATAYKDAGRLDEGRATAVRALEMIERRLGRAHEDVLHPLAVLAMIDELRQRPAEMRASVLRMQEILRTQRGPDDPDLSVVATLLGAAARLDKNPTEMEAQFRRAIAIHEKAFGADSLQVARNRIDLAEGLLDFDEIDAAAKELTLARSRAEASASPDDVGSLHYHQARVEWARGQRTQAVATARSAEVSCRAGCSTALSGRIAAWQKTHR